MKKATKITFSLFSGGFLLFSLYKYFSQKRISKEQVSKIIRKISNVSIHFMFQRYDSQDKILNQKKEQNLVNSQNSQGPLLSQISNNINKINEEEKNKNEENFDNEVLFVLLQIESE